MAAKKTTKKPARRRPKKKKGANPNWLLRGALLMAVLAVIAAVALLSVSWERLFPPTVDKQWVESVLIAADVDLTADREIVEKDGVERWKIKVASADKKEAILNGLRSLVESGGGAWLPGEELTRGGRNLHLVELVKSEGGPLRLIFETDLGVRAKPVAARVRQPPRAEPPAPDPTPPAERKEALTAPSAPAIAVIIDDVGHQPLSQIQPLLDLNFPITFAVLPHLAYSRANAISLNQRQYEVMLHMPMEPDDYPKNNPGEGAVFSDQSEAAIRQRLDQALRDVPFVTGVNNHMGSKITANRGLMRPILDEVKQRGLFFIDSRTNANTVAYTLARSMGLATAKRDVFLDARESHDFAVKQLAEARRVARKNGLAIVIGHPYPSSVQALVEELPKMDREGFRLIFASDAVQKPNEQL